MSKTICLSRKAILELIIVPEVSSEAYYNLKLKSPIYPGGGSGVTVMMGYDLGFQTPLQIQKDLAGIMSPNEIAILQKYAGKKGIVCETYIPQLKGIKISWDKAVKLFYKTSLPRYVKMATDVYPELETLHPYEITAIVSVVYNRGSKLTDSPDDKQKRRTEMRLLVDAIKADDDNKMSSLIRNMKRLWVNKGLDGLLKRYDNIAQYIDMVDIPIPDNDKLLIEI